MDGDGSWCVTYGSGGLGDALFLQRLAEECDEYRLTAPSIVWITAEIPVPEPVEIEGRVE